MEHMTPKERVFGTLRNLRRIVAETENLNTERERLATAIDRCISWESELVDVVTHNVKLRGAPLLARPSRTPCWASVCVGGSSSLAPHGKKLPDG
jgi:hypothetical protein